MTVAVLGIRHTVTITPDMPDTESGHYNGQQAAITVEAGFCPQVTRGIVLHEIVHAIESTLDLELTEHQVACLAAGLNSIPQLTLRLEDE